MESLLALSFDNIASRDLKRIKKGIRQIEGLLAQVCLDEATSMKEPFRNQTFDVHKDPSLTDLSTDPAFCEFSRLQDGSKWNVASRLVACLERLLGFENGQDANEVVQLCLELLLGLLILHAPSRCLFYQENHMVVILDLLDTASPASIQSQALLVLVSALLGQSRNARTFETLDGLMTIASLFKSKTTTKEVKVKTVEFFYFYLMPETAPQSKAEDTLMTRTIEEKQEMLGKYMNNVADLVQDLRDSAPFA